MIIIAQNFSLKTSISTVILGLASVNLLSLENVSFFLVLPGLSNFGFYLIHCEYFAVKTLDSVTVLRSTDIFGLADN